MPTTPRGYPTPAYGTPPDVPGDLQALAEAIDADMTAVDAAGDAATTLLAALGTVLSNQITTTIAGTAGTDLSLATCGTTLGVGKWLVTAGATACTSVADSAALALSTATDTLLANSLGASDTLNNTTPLPLLSRPVVIVRTSGTIQVRPRVVRNGGSVPRVQQVGANVGPSAWISAMRIG